MHAPTAGAALGALDWISRIRGGADRGGDLQACHLRTLWEGSVQLRPARGGSSVPTLNLRSEVDQERQLGSPRGILGCGTTFCVKSRSPPEVPFLLALQDQSFPPGPQPHPSPLTPTLA